MSFVLRMCDISLLFIPIRKGSQVVVLFLFSSNVINLKMKKDYLVYIDMKVSCIKQVSLKGTFLMHTSCGDITVIIIVYDTLY